MQNLPPITWLLVAAAVLVGAGLSWPWRWYRQYRARKRLVSAISSAGSDHLADVAVPDGMGGVFHVDFLVLTSRCILVVDLRDVRGNIFGGDQMTQWTVMDGPHRSTFLNPHGGLYDRIAAVKALAGEIPVEGRVVFTRRGKFPKGLPKWTLMIDALCAEFPMAERAALAESAAQLDEGWQRLKEHARPSSMGHAR